MSRRAVFLDRDGVVTQLALNPATGEYESPHSLGELSLLPGATAAARSLSRAGFLLFTVSNQPSYAKGKVGLGVIKEIAAKTAELLDADGVKIARAFYCYHHPQGIVPEYSMQCRCRKPKPQMLFDARDEFDLDLSRCWMIGDQESDVECGRRAGCRTVLVENPVSAKRRPGVEQPTLRAKDLADAAAQILKTEGLQ
ncbi:MAG TPA: HAD-IIIA family hydrolase [Planctomycetota bacterium]|nr:HAD-IIIA family hydrolase [Planctomycetota bacterium]